MNISGQPSWFTSEIAIPKPNPSTVIPDSIVTSEKVPSPLFLYSRSLLTAVPSLIFFL